MNNSALNNFNFYCLSFSQQSLLKQLLLVPSVV